MALELFYGRLNSFTLVLRKDAHNEWCVVLWSTRLEGSKLPVGEIKYVTI